MIDKLFLIYCIGLGLMCQPTPEVQPISNLTFTGNISINWGNITYLNNSLINATYEQTAPVCDGIIIEIQKGGCYEKTLLYEDAKSKFEVENQINPIISDSSEMRWAYKEYITDCSTMMIKCVNASWEELGRNDRKLVVEEG